MAAAPPKNNHAQNSEMRKELAKDLRKAHFHLGFKQGMDEKSRYIESYKEYNLDAAEETKQEMLKLRKDLRSTHYQLGTDESSKLFISTASQSFKQPVNPQVSQLSVETKKDLRSHHFTLGNHFDAQQSNYKNSFYEKGVKQDNAQDRKEQVNALRKHNHDFGDNKDYYSSLYNENYNNSYDPEFLKQGKSKEEILQEIVDLRKTNLVMGNHKASTQSEAMSEYKTNPSSKASGVELGLKATHFTLGEDKPAFQTTTKQSFQGQQIVLHDPNKIKALSKDLRAEHFQLGNEKRQFTSEAAAKFKDIDQSSLTKQPDMSHLYKSHFDMEGFGGNDKNIQNHYLSSYKKQYDQPAPIKQVGQTRNDRADRTANIVLGSDKLIDQFQSEAAKNFVDFKGTNSSALDKETKENLRRHHFAFGTDPATLASEMKATFNDKSKDATKSQLDEALVKDLRKHHFEYGTQHNNFTTTTNDIGKYQGPSSKLDPALAKDLRSHHFKQVDHHKYYDSTYKLNYPNPETV